MKPIVIIGAGIAGLQAASHLHRQNVPFVLLEQADRAGGRVQTEQVDGFILDHGFQVLQTNYPAVQRSFDLSALNLQAFDSGSKLWLGGQWTSFLNPLRAGLGMLKLVPHVISIKDLFLLARLWFNLQGSTNEHIQSGENTAEMLGRWGFSDTFQTKFIRPFFRGIFLDQHLQQPASLFFFYMRQFLEGQAALPAKGMGEVANQLLESLPADSIRFGAEVADLSERHVKLKGGESLEFERLIVALDSYSAANLLQVDLPDFVHLGSKTFYFSSPARQVKDKLLHLIPGESKLLHYCFLSHVAPNYAPKGKDLIQVTSLDLSLEAEEALSLLASYEDVKGMKLLKAFIIPRSLSKVGVFDSLKHAADARGFILAGDYCEMPSLQGALVSGEKAAVRSLI
ncbi:protoporphyrinogen/coproporphyrinogen oxidase [Aquirufa regiilacus]|uniref:FAD-dependent oxidoreductase n=1 Tax=Aquirufa regiilacus TaxID=3024868 RepID=A0ABU3TP71_9BACT|nr:MULTISPECIES: FAD-dependent oxidoreductase [unclassified Aquirufa]MDT8887060.1 FAD-dependent oxidoreductase [Aquirufa sp. LEPPI-3A]MDU0807663.1 FAD-dependent oxidoreductase [Aquirufa sp. LEOWEIH-7C]